MKSRERIIVAVSLALVMGALAIGILDNVLSLTQTNRTISSVGSVKGIGVGVYWDSTCANPITSLNWWTLDPGASKSVLVYIRNEGNSAVTLTKAVQNWNPSAASSYMTLNWDYNGQTLSVNQVLQLKLTLAVSPTISGITGFSFDIIITATG